MKCMLMSFNNISTNGYKEESSFAFPAEKLFDPFPDTLVKFYF